MKDRHCLGGKEESFVSFSMIAYLFLVNTSQGHLRENGGLMGVSDPCWSVHVIKKRERKKGW
jgi:hypothetical protein